VNGTIKNDSEDGSTMRKLSILWFHFYLKYLKQW